MQLNQHITGLFFVLALLCSVASGVYGQNWNWAKQASSPNKELAYDVEVDRTSEQVFICGMIEDASAFAAITPAMMNGGTNNGKKDGFLARYDDHGNLVWVVNMGSSNDDEALDAAIGDDGRIYLTGYFSGTLRLNSTSAALVNLSSTGGTDAFTACYDSLGNLQWAKTGGGPQQDYGVAITVNAGGVFTAGHYSNNASFGALNTEATYNNKVNHFIISYSTAGAEQNLMEIKSEQHDFNPPNFEFKQMALVSDEDSIYIITHFQGNSLRFVDGTGTLVPGVSLTNGGGENLVIASFSKTGAFNWGVKVEGTGSPQLGLGIAVDCNGIYACGSLHDGSSFKSGYTLATGDHDNPVLWRMDHGTGADIWVRGWGSSTSHADVCRDIWVDDYGQIYVAGYFKSNGFSNLDTNLGNPNGTDIFIARFLSNGTFDWAEKITDQNDDYAMAITGYEDSEILIAGMKDGNMTFPPLTLTSGNNQDIFVAKRTVVKHWSASTNGTCCQLPLPSVSLAGTNDTICDSIYILNANTPGVGMGRWKRITGAGQFGSVTDPGSSIKGLAANDNNLVWTIRKKYCVSSRDTVNIYRYQFPSKSNAGPNDTICGTTYSFAANTPSAGQGKWVTLSGTGLVASPNSPTSAVTNLKKGFNSFEWSISNGNCSPERDTVIIIVDSLPPAANAGINDTICASSYLLSANSPAYGQASWKVLSGTGVVVTVTNPTSTVNTLSIGSNKLIWTISNGTCPASEDTVEIIRDAIPTSANAGINDTLCSSAYTLAANVPAIGTGNWNVLAGTGNVSSPSVPGSGVTGMSDGANKFEWVISNGTCPPSRDTVLIVVDSVPTTAFVGTNDTLCDPNYLLTGNKPVVGTGQWTVDLGTGILNSPSTDTTSVTGMSDGANKFVWSISNGTCPTSTDTVLIVVDSIPTKAYAGSNDTLCNSTYTLNGNNPVIGNGIWTVFQGTSSLTTPSSSGSGVIGMGDGANQFIWTISNGTCPSSSDTVLIVVDSVPTVSFAGVNDTLCNPTYILNANNPIVGVGQWQVIQGTGTLNSPSTDTTTVNGMSDGANRFVWSISNGTCPTSSDTVLIVVDSLPSAAIAGVNDTICSTSSYVLGATPPQTGLGTWMVISGATFVSSPNNPAGIAQGLAYGHNELQWKVENGTCPPNFDTVIIWVDTLPTVAFAGANDSVCGPLYNLGANVPISGNGSWYAQAPGPVFVNANVPTTQVSNLAPGFNYLIWAIKNGVCPASTDTVQILSYAMPAKPFAGLDDTVCIDTTWVTGSLPSIGVGKWYTGGGTGIAVNDTALSTRINNLSGGMNSFIWQVTNGLCVSGDTVNVVRLLPFTTNAGADQVLCGLSISLQANENNGNGQWQSTLNASFDDPDDPNATVTVTGSGKYKFTWIETDGYCSDTDYVSVQFSEKPLPAYAGPDQLLDFEFTSQLEADPPSAGLGTWSSIQGLGHVSTITDPKSAVSNLTIGENKFEWKIINGTCPPTLDTVLIYVKDLFIPNGFSPNNDMSNDYFVVKGIDKVPNKVRIFTRWGNTVYETKDYNNDWAGTGPNGSDLPDDTYYYVIELTELGEKYSGYFELKR